MGMDYEERKAIETELLKMDIDVSDLYDEAQRVYKNLDNWRDYTLTEMIDAVTFERRWYWRRKA